MKGVCVRNKASHRRHSVVVWGDARKKTQCIVCAAEPPSKRSTNRWDLEVYDIQTNDPLCFTPGVKKIEQSVSGSERIPLATNNLGCPGDCFFSRRVT